MIMKINQQEIKDEKVIARSLIEMCSEKHSSSDILDDLVYEGLLHPDISENTTLDGIVYFVTDGNFVKIGLSNSNSFKSRISGIQTGNAMPIRILFCYRMRSEETAWVESYLHHYFSEFRLMGEWFNIKDFIVGGKSAARKLRQYVMEKQEREAFDAVQRKDVLDRLAEQAKWIAFFEPQLAEHLMSFVKEKQFELEDPDDEDPDDEDS